MGGYSENAKGHMDAPVFLGALLILLGIPALTILKIARLRANRPQSLPADVTQRLDFAERLLNKAREERR